MNKAIPQTTTATFRQLLRGQLIWLECCPAWACAEIYAQRIHPLIVAEYREDDMEEPGAVADLINALSTCEPGDCGLVIAKWLEKPEQADA